jgi:hypothetical protein
MTSEVFAYCVSRAVALSRNFKEFETWYDGASAEVTA